MSVITSLPAPPTTTAPVAQTQADQARTSLSANFDTFLKLLTTQLQNQDPLSPMDSTQFTQQLVQYSQVEQQIQTNTQLTTLTDTLTKQVQAASAGAALAYIGKTATFDSDAAPSAGAGAQWGYNLAAAAVNNTLSVTDDAGNVIYQATGELAAGDHTFTWNGKNSAGDAAPAGLYHLKVGALDGSGAAITATTSVTELITGVDLSATDAAVTTSSGTRPFTSIVKVGG
jgi:flagellar basal-body rod modification protein FlgD